ncbi:hypothetical protein KTR66_23755, partial [Roseococcus sp. SDR]|nr:hypothetical protein [Roseococcus sp. SDR]MBV1848332.1 hypothetical protein [Roseococcus sp. SDR]
MGQEPDVARVAAAMNTPGLKYRSFGNLPVRTEPARGDGASLGPQEVLRELRTVSAALRAEEAAPAAAPQAEPPSAMAPIMAVPPIDDAPAPLPPAPRLRPAAPAAAPRPAAPRSTMAGAPAPSPAAPSP